MTKTAKAKPVKAKKTTTAQELKAWLQGIQEFQPADWTPNKAQWDAIRDRIMSLPEIVPVTLSNQTYEARPAPQYYPPEDEGPNIFTPGVTLAGPTHHAGQSSLAAVGPAGQADHGRVAGHLGQGDGLIPVVIDARTESGKSGFA